MESILERMSVNADLARRVIVGFIRDALGKTGFTSAVIGLSGGIDSSLVAYLTAEALGVDNVLAVMMPYAPRTRIAKAMRARSSKRWGCRRSRSISLPWLIRCWRRSRLMRLAAAATSWRACA